MPVNLSAPERLLPVDGILLGCARAIKSKRRNDLTAMEITPGATVAGVFTRNRFAAPPVQVCREHLRGEHDIRGLIINAGIANAGTAGRGLRDARKTCQLFADIVNARAQEKKSEEKKNACRARNVLPFSTGVIMEYLPMEQYAAGLLACRKNLAANNWLAAARAIMTTDTVPKGASRRVKVGKNVYTVTGIAKGSGMIHPNMATMLAFVATDARIPKTTLARWQRWIVADTFNSISVDGDTSTNDSFMLIATGKGGTCSGVAAEHVRCAIAEVCGDLADAIVRDGEGATKFVTIRVCGGASFSVCRSIAESIACSPLVKTALAAGDANVGRFLMAIGNASAGFALHHLNMSIGGVPIIKSGCLHPKYNEQKASEVLAGDEFVISITLGNSPHEAVVKTCDLTHKYISINADYRS